MEVDARGYWVCPGCARLVNRDVNREYRAMPVTGIQSIVWHTADLDQVSDDVRWEKFPKADSQITIAIPLSMMAVVEAAGKDAVMTNH